MKNDENKKNHQELTDAVLDSVSGGKNTVNFIHDGKTTCTLIVENKKVTSVNGKLDVPKDIFLEVMMTKDNLKFSKKEAEKIYRDLTSNK